MQNFIYHYIDRWSSPYTWGNNPPPIAGDFVYVSAHQTVMLDQDTPILEMLLIDGGTFFFDPTSAVELRSKYILIINGGTFQASYWNALT